MGDKEVTLVLFSFLIFFFLQTFRQLCCSAFLAARSKRKSVLIGSTEMSVELIEVDALQIIQQDFQTLPE